MHSLTFLGQPSYPVFLNIKMVVCYCCPLPPRSMTTPSSPSPYNFVYILTPAFLDEVVSRGVATRSADVVGRVGELYMVVLVSSGISELIGHVFL